MQKLSKFGIVVVIGTVMTVSALAAGKAFVTVNGTAVSQEAADLYMAQWKARGMSESPELKDNVREEMIRRELMFQEARRTGLDKKPEIAAEAEAAKRKIVAQAETAKQIIVVRAYMQDLVSKTPITDAQLKSQYDTIKAKGGGKEYKVRHILVKNEADALAVIAKLKKGAKFADLAAESIDSGSKFNGGDLGWSIAGKFVKPFADALARMNKGKTSETPVKTDYGYHVIQLEDTRPLSIAPFDELKPMLVRAAQEQMLNKTIAGLRAKARID
jgi:peptidyl-prolyl cis-trans isomerase C